MSVLSKEVLEETLERRKCGLPCHPRHIFYGSPNNEIMEATGLPQDYPEKFKDRDDFNAYLVKGGRHVMVLKDYIAGHLGPWAEG